MNLSQIKATIFNDCYAKVGIAAFSALIIAYLSEILLNLQPCILCIYQRIPYFILLLIILLSMFIKRTRIVTRHLVLLSLLGEIITAFYHVGIEHYIFEEDFTCKDPSQIGNMLTTKKIASSCSLAAFKFMNLSMAEWNFIFASTLLVYFIYQEKEYGFFTWRSKER